MKFESNYYYLTDEEIAEVRYESTEQLARKALGLFTMVLLFGGTVLRAMFTLLGV